MAYEKRKDGIWREWLTAEESTRIAKIDRQLAKLETLRTTLEPLRAERLRIANRAVQRARYAAKPKR